MSEAEAKYHGDPVLEKMNLCPGCGFAGGSDLEHIEYCHGLLRKAIERVEEYQRAMLNLETLLRAQKKSRIILDLNAANRRLTIENDNLKRCLEDRNEQKRVVLVGAGPGTDVSAMLRKIKAARTGGRV